MSEEIGWFSEDEVRYGSVAWSTHRRRRHRARTDIARPDRPSSPLATSKTTSTSSKAGRRQPTSDPTQMEVVMPIEHARFLGIQVGTRSRAASTFDDCNRPPASPDPTGRELQNLSAARLRPSSAAAHLHRRRLRRAGTTARTASGRPARLLLAALRRRTSMAPSSRCCCRSRRSSRRFRPRCRVSPTTSSSRLRRHHPPELGEPPRRARPPSIACAAASRTPARSRTWRWQHPLASFQNRASFNQVTLLLLLLQVVGIAIYYVVLVSSLLAERRSEEIAMLRSRGATVGQLVAMSTAEAFALGLVAAFIAPFIASAGVAVLGRHGHVQVDLWRRPPAVHAGARRLPVRPRRRRHRGDRDGDPGVLRGPTRHGLLPALVGPARQVDPSALLPGRRPRRARGAGAVAAQPEGQRLRRPQCRWLVGRPAVAALAAAARSPPIGALMFRFLPPVLAVVIAAAARTSGPGVTLGLWQLTRSPGRYTQLALLVVMAAAVGTFAATYGKTTDVSQEERALYAVGLDVRLTGLGKLGHNFDAGGTRSSSPSRASTRRRRPTGAATRWDRCRTSAPASTCSASTRRRSRPLWFRDDFADQDLRTLLLQDQRLHRRRSTASRSRASRPRSRSG